MKGQTFTSFAAMAAVVKAEINRDDVRKAANLRKSAPIAQKAPGTGPRVAR